MNPVILHLLSISSIQKELRLGKANCKSILTTFDGNDMVNNEEEAFASDNMDTILNLLSYSRDEEILSLVIHSMTVRIEEFGGERLKRRPNF